MQSLERYTEGQRIELFSSLKDQFSNGLPMTTGERALFAELKEYFKPEAKDRKAVISKLNADAKKLVDMWNDMQELYNDYGNISPKDQKAFDKLEKAYDSLDTAIVRYIFRRNVTASEFFTSEVSYHWEGYEFEELLDAYSYLNRK